jgi:eukaryotic-like serine/threonine-protein kinase
MKKRFVLLLLVSSLFISPILVETQFSNEVQAQTSTADWWSMFQHDSTHRGYSTSSAPNTSETRFIVNYTISHNEYASPIVVDNRLIVAGGGNRSLYAIEATTGRFLWASTELFSTDATPAVSENRVVVPSSNGYLYCFSAIDGSLIWKYKICEGGYGNLPSPIIYNGMVFHAEGSTPSVRDGGYIYALSLFEMMNETAPKLIWKRFLNSSVTSSPAYSDGKIILNFSKKPLTSGGETKPFVVALDFTNGNLIWNMSEIGGGRSSPTISNGRVCFGAYRDLVCVNESSGEVLWTSTFRTDIYASPAISNNRVYVGTLAHRGPNIPAVFYCLNLTTGNIEWEYETGDYTMPSSPCVADGKVFVCAGNRVFAFNGTEGNVVWTYETMAYSGSSPIVVLDCVFVIDGGGYVYCFAPLVYYNLTINPNFCDNLGEPLSSAPSSWIILFPNGTEKILYDVQTFYCQMGFYSISNVIWKGYEVLRNQTVRFLLYSDTAWTSNINCILPTDLTLYLSSASSAVGLQINVIGQLSCNNKGVSYAPVLLSYSVTNGETWNEITQISTSSSGEYSAIWMPTATGQYLVKAEWVGNTTFPKSSIQSYMVVLPVQEQNVISVSSNSKVSNLVFNSSINEIHFTLSDLTEPTGYSDVSVPKNLVGNIQPEVFCDGKEIDHETKLIEDTWLIHFSYITDVDEVTISMNPSSIPFDISDFDFLPIVLVLTVVAICGIIIYFSRRSRLRK